MSAAVVHHSGVQKFGGTNVWEGVWNQFLRTVLHTISTTVQNIMFTGCYNFILSLNTKSRMGHTKNQSSEKMHKKDKQGYYVCYKQLLRAVNNDFLKVLVKSFINKTKRESERERERERDRERERERDRERDNVRERERDKTWTRKRRKETLTERQREGERERERDRKRTRNIIQDGIRLCNF